MGATEKVLDVIHEIGILAVMLLFIYTGGVMMQSYAGFGDFLPVAAGLALMITGAIVVVRTPQRLRRRTAERYARLAHENGEEEAEPSNAGSERSLVRIKA